MPRKIYVRVDTSPQTGGAVEVLINDAIEQFDLSNRETIFKMILEAIQRTCGVVLEAGYDTGRALFGQWDTWFSIPTEAHNDNCRKMLSKELHRIYQENSSLITGMLLEWDGDRFETQIKEAKVAMERFGTLTSTLPPDFVEDLNEYKKRSRVLLNEYHENNRTPDKGEESGYMTSLIPTLNQFSGLISEISIASIGGEDWVAIALHGDAQHKLLIQWHAPVIDNPHPINRELFIDIVPSKLIVPRLNRTFPLPRDRQLRWRHIRTFIKDYEPIRIGGLDEESRKTAREIGLERDIYTLETIDQMKRGSCILRASALLDSHLFVGENASLEYVLLEVALA